MPNCSLRKKSKNERRTTTAGFPSPFAEKIGDHDTPTGVLLRKHVPKDDSCLFNSIYFLLNGKLDETGHVARYIRQLVAEVIKSNDKLYNRAVLGKSVAKYCDWIQQKTSWGGAIEISILANYYGLEIVVVDCTSGAMSIFGEDKNFMQQAFLLYNGTHYDPLYLKSYVDGSTYTIFRSDNRRIFTEAKQLGMKGSLKFEVRKDGSRKAKHMHSKMM